MISSLQGDLGEAAAMQLRAEEETETRWDFPQKEGHRIVPIPFFNPIILKSNDPAPQMAESHLILRHSFLPAFLPSFIRCFVH